MRRKLFCFWGLALLASVFLPERANAQQIVSWGCLETNFNADVISVASGYSYHLMLARNGTVTAFGDASPWSSGPVEAPPGLVDYMGIAANWYGGLGLKSNGAVFSWGLTNKVAQPVSGLTSVVAIASSVRSALALRADGTVVAFSGQNTNVPAGLTNVVAISAGSGYLALKADGRVVAWNWPTYLTNGIGSLEHIVAISAGYEEWLALAADGTVSGAGSYTIPSGLSNIVGVASSSGNDHHISMVRHGDGTVSGWGFNFCGGPSQGPKVPPGLSQVVAFAGGGGHNIALVGGGPPVVVSPLVDRSIPTQGRVHFRVEAVGAWPLAYQWQFDGVDIPGQTQSVLTLTNVQPNQQGLYSVRVSNALGTATSRSARLYVTGVLISTPPQDQLTFGGGGAVFSVIAQGALPMDYQWTHAGKQIPGATNSVLQLGNVQFAQAGDYAAVISNAYGAITSAVARLLVQPMLITNQPKDQVTYLRGPAVFEAQVLGIGPLAYQWSYNGTAIPFATNASLTLTNMQPQNSGIYSVAVSNSYGVVTSTPAQLSVVNVASWGLFGRNSVPPSATNCFAIDTQARVAYARNGAGQWSSWGDYAELIQEDLTTEIDITGDFLYVLGLREDGTLEAWGTDSQGTTNVPPGLTNVVSISAQYSHALALTADGRVVAWGDGSTVPAGLDDCVGIAAGGHHSLALKADGTIAVWGMNQFGQTNLPPGDPITNGVAVAAGWWHNLVLKTDGTVVGFGLDDYGQASPPAGLSNVVAIACGNFHSLALKDDGTVVAWGMGKTVTSCCSEYGQSIVPPELTNVIAIAGGNYFSLALIGDAPPLLKVSPEFASWDEGGFSVRVPSQAGRVFRLEYKNAAEESNWTPLPLVAGTGRSLTLKDPTAQGTQRFYRVRRW